MRNAEDRPDDQRRSTIKDVAAEAEVAISTVSLVINGKENVSDATRARVLAAADRLGYVPTAAARRLVLRRTGNIGFVLRDDHFTRSEPFYTRIFLGTEFEARTANLYVLLTTIPAAYEPGRDTPRFLRERNVDGLIVAGKVDAAFLAEVAEHTMPTVLVDFERDELPAVVIDNEGGARAAVGHLVSRGHRRIAFLGTDLGHPSLRARLEGYRSALRAHGLPAPDDVVVTEPAGEPTRLAGARLAGTLLAVRPRPSAVLCANDALALGVLDAARAHGVAVPSELAVVGFDDVEGAATSSPPLTTLRVFKEQLGELALRTLTGTLAEPTGRYRRVQPSIRVPTELIVRGST